MPGSNSTMLSTPSTPRHWHRRRPSGSATCRSSKRIRCSNYIQTKTTHQQKREVFVDTEISGRMASSSSPFSWWTPGMNRNQNADSDTDSEHRRRFTERAQDFAESTTCKILKRCPVSLTCLTLPSSRGRYIESRLSSRCRRLNM